MAKAGTSILRLIVLAVSMTALSACADGSGFGFKTKPEAAPQPSESERALAAAQQNATRLDHLEQQFNAMVDDWLKFRPVISRLSELEEDLNKVISDVANLKAGRARISTSRRADAPSGGGAPSGSPSGAGTPPVEVIPGASAARKAPSSTNSTMSFAVHLASYRSKEALMDGWSELKRRFPNELGELDSTSQALDLGRDGTYYRLKAGPLRSKEDALEICQIMTRSGAYCVPSDFSGDKIN